jgi:hypothetical protein
MEVAIMDILASFTSSLITKRLICISKIILTVRSWMGVLLKVNDCQNHPGKLNGPENLRKCRSSTSSISKTRITQKRRADDCLQHRSPSDGDIEVDIQNFSNGLIRYTTEDEKKEDHRSIGPYRKK